MTRLACPVVLAVSGVEIPEMYILAIQRQGEHGPYTEMRRFDDLYDAHVQLHKLWNQGYRQIKLIQS